MSDPFRTQGGYQIPNGTGGGINLGGFNVNSLLPWLGLGLSAYSAYAGAQNQNKVNEQNLLAQQQRYGDLRNLVLPNVMQGANPFASAVLNFLGAGPMVGGPTTGTPAFNWSPTYNNFLGINPNGGPVGAGTPLPANPNYPSGPGWTQPTTTDWEQLLTPQWEIDPTTGRITPIRPVTSAPVSGGTTADPYTGTTIYGGVQPFAPTPGGIMAPEEEGRAPGTFAFGAPTNNIRDWEVRMFDPAQGRTRVLAPEEASRYMQFSRNPDGAWNLVPRFGTNADGSPAMSGPMLGADFIRNPSFAPFDEVGQRHLGLFSGRDTGAPSLDAAGAALYQQRYGVMPTLEALSAPGMQMAASQGPAPVTGGGAPVYPGTSGPPIPQQMTPEQRDAWLRANGYGHLATTPPPAGQSVVSSTAQMGQAPTFNFGQLGGMQRYNPMAGFTFNPMTGTAAQTETQPGIGFERVGQFGQLPQVNWGGIDLTGTGTQAFNAGQDALMQSLRRDIAGLRDLDLERNLSQVINGQTQFNNTDLFRSLAAQDETALNRQVAQLQGSFGSLGQRFGTAAMDREAQLRREFLENTSTRNLQLGRESFEAAQGRRLQGMGIGAGREQYFSEIPFRNAQMHDAAAQALANLGLGQQDTQLRAGIANAQGGLQAQQINAANMLDLNRLNQQAQMANQAAGITTGTTNAQLAQQAALANADARNRMVLANMEAVNNLGQFNASQQQRAGEFNAQQQNIYNQLVLQGLGMANQFQNAQYNQNLGFLGLLAGIPVPQQMPSAWPGAIAQMGQATLFPAYYQQMMNANQQRS